MQSNPVDFHSNYHQSGTKKSTEAKLNAIPFNHFEAIRAHSFRAAILRVYKATELGR